MLTFIVFGLVSLGVFYIGYYFGNQTGRTAHIRGYLSEARKLRSRE